MAECTKILEVQGDVRALQDTIYVIGGKWKLPIIHSLCNGNRRFSDLERSIPGITKRMLSKSLKELEDNKLIIRTAYPASPGAVEYDFTEYAKEYGMLINTMIEWGKKHRSLITGKQTV